MSAQSETSRPGNVKTAVYLFITTLLIGIIRSTLESSAQLQTVPLWLLMIFVLIIYLVIGGLIYMIYAGKNWARYLFSVLFVIGLPLSIKPMIVSLSNTPVSGFLGILQSILQLIGIVFLFTKESSSWFKSRKAKVQE